VLELGARPRLRFLDQPLSPVSKTEFGQSSLASLREPYVYFNETFSREPGSDR
jgi:hypothetical protein